MNCCNSFGKCTQGQDCAIRGCSQSKGRDNEQSWVNSVSKPIQYIPKVDEPPIGMFEDFLEFVSATWRPVLFGFFCAIALILWLLLRG